MRTLLLATVTLLAGVASAARGQAIAELPVGARIRYVDVRNPEWRVARVVARDSSALTLELEGRADSVRTPVSDVIQMETWHRGLGSRGRLMLIGGAVGAVAVFALGALAVRSCDRGADSEGPGLCNLDWIGATLVAPLGIAAGVTGGWLLPASEWRAVSVR